MRKLMIACIGIIVTGLLVTIGISLTPQVMKVSLEHKGDRSLMEGITLQAQYSQNSTSLDVTVKDGVADLKKGSNATGIELPEYEAIKQYYEDQTVVDELMATAGECEQKVDQLEAVNLRYQLTGLKSDKTIMIDTSLQEHSNDKFAIRRTLKDCKKTTDSVSYEEVYRNSESMWKGGYLNLRDSNDRDTESEEAIVGEMTQSLLKLSDDEYYFLPYTDAYTTGIPSLYHIQLSNLQGSMYLDSTITEQVALPEGRIYQDLRLMGNKLVLFSHDRTSLYVQTYELDGTLVKEVSFEYPKRLDEFKMELYSNEQYVILKDEKSIMVADLTDPANKQVISWNGGTVVDIICRNGTVYVASVETNGRQMKISAIQHQETVYEGIVTVPQYGERGRFMTYDVIGFQR